MKTLLVYDSLYGNTKTIAQTIGDAIPGEVEVLHVAKESRDIAGQKRLVSLRG